MRDWQVKSVLCIYFLSVLFFNKVAFLLYGYIVNAILLFVFLIDIKNVRRFNFGNNIYGFRMLILIFYGLLSLAWTPNFDGSVTHLQVLSVMVANSFIVFYFLKRYNALNILVAALLVYSFINCTLALGLPIFNFLENKSVTFRFIGTELNPNYLAITLIFSILLSLVSLQGRIVGRSWMFIHSSNIILSLYAILLTGSRKGILFGFLLVLIYLVINYSFWIPFVRRNILFILLGLVVLSFMNIEVISSNIEKPLERVNRMFSSVEGTDNEGSTVSRIMFIREGWKMFQLQPWFGYGIGSFSYYFGKYAHNNYIELLFGLGFLGPIIFYSVHYSLLKDCLKHRVGFFIPSFIFVLLMMDVGLVSYSEKRIMLIFISLIIIVDRLKEERNPILT
jgi:O-antigen ligase